MIGEVIWGGGGVRILIIILRHDLVLWPSLRDDEVHGLGPIEDEAGAEEGWGRTIMVTTMEISRCGKQWQLGQWMMGGWRQGIGENRNLVPTVGHLRSTPVRLCVDTIDPRRNVNMHVLFIWRCYIEANENNIDSIKKMGGGKWSFSTSTYTYLKKYCIIGWRRHLCTKFMDRNLSHNIVMIFCRRNSKFILIRNKVLKLTGCEYIIISMISLVFNTYILWLVLKPRVDCIVSASLK